MGYFSWRTADTGESIWNVGSGMHPGKPVYLLQPNGLPAICEPLYAGYGVFGGVSAYAWLARMNMPELSAQALNEDALTDIGIALEAGFYLDPKTGARWSFGGIHPGTSAFSAYDQRVAGYVLNPNKLIMVGIWVKRKVELRYPLKFSFDPGARYEDLPSSAICPYQGFFAPDKQAAIR